MARLADAVATSSATLEPASAETFRSNAAAFKDSLGGLETRLAAIKSSAGHAPVAVTEPVPLYLLEAAGLENQTPAEYTAAIEEDTDVPPAVLKATVDLVASGGIRLLAYNTQTEGPQTAALKKAAETAGVPVVDFSETLPGGQVLPAVDDRECGEHRQGPRMIATARAAVSAGNRGNLFDTGSEPPRRLPGVRPTDSVGGPGPGHQPG